MRLSTFAVGALVCLAGFFTTGAGGAIAEPVSNETEEVLLEYGIVNYKQVGDECTGITSISGNYAGEEQAVVTIEQYDYATDTFGPVTPSARVSARTDPEWDAPVIGQDRIVLKRASDREAADQRFELRVKTVEDAGTFRVVFAGMEQSEQGGAWTITVASFDSYCLGPAI